MVLRDWAIQFLECCYNILMKVVRVIITLNKILNSEIPSKVISIITHTHTLARCQENIMHQRAMDNDETYYLWATRFFMEFSRHHHFRVDIVA